MGGAAGRWAWMAGRARVGAAVLAGGTVLVLTACGGGDAGGDADQAAQAPQGTPVGDVAQGQALYASNCAVCHGPQAQGTAVGPPFLHEVYVPSHHPDEAFFSAVRNGVQPHHWEFGPMPPVQGLDDEEIAHIVAWVRAQQAEAGIVD